MTGLIPLPRMPSTTGQNSATAISPGGSGLSYRTDWGIIPYANYSTSFSPNIGYVYDPVSNIRRVARATTAEQMEVGVKYEIPDTNAVLSAAYFDISQKDGLVYDGTFDDRATSASASSISIRAASSWKQMRPSTMVLV